MSINVFSSPFVTSAVINVHIWQFSVIKCLYKCMRHLNQWKNFLTYYIQCSYYIWSNINMPQVLMGFIYGIPVLKQKPTKKLAREINMLWFMKVHMAIFISFLALQSGVFYNRKKHSQYPTIWNTAVSFSSFGQPNIPINS